MEYRPIAGTLNRFESIQGFFYNTLSRFGHSKYFVILTIFLMAFLIYSLLLAFVVVSAFLVFLKTRVPFVPTPIRDLEKLKDLGFLKSGEKILDLGSGDGRVVFKLEKMGMWPAGTELGRWMYYWAKIRKLWLNSKAEFFRKDLFGMSWKEYNVIYCYLYPPLMRRVGEKAKTELLPGSKVISRDFPIPNLRLIAKVHIRDKHDFFVYEVN